MDKRFVYREGCYCDANVDVQERDNVSVSAKSDLDCRRQQPARSGDIFSSTFPPKPHIAFFS